MATALLPAWAKVRAQIDRQAKTNDTEQQLLDKMAGVFEQHSQNALSMTT